MSRPVAWALFVAAWLLSLTALAPMRWLGEPDAWRQAGVSATGATGTIWNGQLLGLSWGRHRLGDVDAGVAARSLLAGTLAIELAAQGARATLLAGRKRGLQAASGAWPLLLPTAAGPLPVSLSMDAVSAIFSGDRCVESGGQLRASITLPSAGNLVLSGTALCREGVAEANLLPAAGSPAIELLVQARADGGYRLTWTARGPDASLRQALELAGFAAGADGLVRVDEGSLADALAAQE